MEINNNVWAEAEEMAMRQYKEPSEYIVETIYSDLLRQRDIQESTDSLEEKLESLAE